MVCIQSGRNAIKRIVRGAASRRTSDCAVHPLLHSCQGLRFRKLEVILTTSIDKLGKAGETVKVAPGYFHNHLMPKLLAVPNIDKYAYLIREQCKIYQPVEEESVKVVKETKDNRAKEYESAAKRLDNTQLMRYLSPFSLFSDLLKAREKGSARLLGLDVGDKYVGVAVSDSNNKIASPLSPFDRLRPTGPDGWQVKLLIEDLSRTGKLKYVGYTYWNESYTSKGAELLLRPINLHPVQLKTITDKFAAVGILQGYLDYTNRKLKAESAC